MDPIENINIKKDSSFAMLLEAQKRGHQLYYLQQKDLFLLDNQVQAHTQSLKVKDDPNAWFELSNPQTLLCSDF